MPGAGERRPGGDAVRVGSCRSQEQELAFHLLAPLAGTFLMTTSLATAGLRKPRRGRLQTKDPTRGRAISVESVDPGMLLPERSSPANIGLWRA
eukprot:scaffold3427_cov222-Pinguiococcus_pyrenoidosus.AAC.2